MRQPGERLPVDTVHPYLAARAVLCSGSDGRLEDGTPVRDAVHTIAMPGLGTGVGGVAPSTCAHQVAAAWDEAFNPLPRLSHRLCTTLWTKLWTTVDYCRGATHRSRSTSSVMGMPNSPTAGISGLSLRASRTASGLNAASLNPRRW